MARQQSALVFALLASVGAALKISPVATSRRAAIASAATLALVPPMAAHAGFAGGNPSAGAAAEFQRQKAERAAQTAGTTPAGYKSSSDTPQTFAEIVAYSKAQREASLGMTMSDSEVEKLTEKLRQQFPGVK